MRFRISSRDGRLGYARPYGLIECDSNALVASYRERADAAKAGYLIKKVAPYGRGMTVEELNDVVSEQMRHLYATDDIGRLTFSAYIQLETAVRVELQNRGRRR